MSGITLCNTGLVSAKLLRVSKEELSRKTVALRSVIINIFYYCKNRFMIKAAFENVMK